MELISLQGKTNFFEKRVAEYQKSGVMNSLNKFIFISFTFCIFALFLSYLSIASSKTREMDLLYPLLNKLFVIICGEFNLKLHHI